MTDPINIRELASALPGIFGDVDRWHYFPSVDSTNRAAGEAAATGAPEGSVFLADEQTAGRGRSDHQWHSPRGTGIYLSVVLRPQLPPADVLWIALIAGLAVHSALRKAVSITADLRWPNDVMLGSKKMGGILAELSGGPARARYVILGVGLNVNQSEFPADVRAVATSLRIETSREWPRQEIIAALLESLGEEYHALLSSAGPAKANVLERFAQASTYVRGARVEVHEDGSAGYRGLTAGLDERGFLRVQTESGMRTVISGGVRKI